MKSLAMYNKKELLYCIRKQKFNTEKKIKLHLLLLNKMKHKLKSNSNYAKNKQKYHAINSIIDNRLFPEF